MRVRRAPANAELIGVSLVRVPPRIELSVAELRYLGSRARRASRPKARVHDIPWRRVDAAPLHQTAYAQIGRICVLTFAS